MVFFIKCYQQSQVSCGTMARVVPSDFHFIAALFLFLSIPCFAINSLLRINKK